MSQEEENIAACPWCAGHDLLVLDDEGIYCVLCLECRSCGPTAEDADEAMILWSERADTEVVEAFLARAKRQTYFS